MADMRAIARHKTAIHRRDLSRPVALALEESILRPGLSFFDYGCGHGADVRLLSQSAYDARGWDPRHAPQQRKRESDVVNLGYVINVIEDAAERQRVLAEAYSLSRKTLVVSAQVAYADPPVHGEPFADGIITGKGTFQKYYTQEELRTFIESSLGVEAVAGALGVFYVFRDESERQAHLLRQVARRPRREPRHIVTLEEKLAPHRELLEEFASAVELLGRLPRNTELPELPELQERIGSPKRCVRLCERLFPGFSFAQAQQERREDLLVYIALSRFKRRPQFGLLPEVLQWDIRDLFGSYSRACELGDELLFGIGRPGAIDGACAKSAVGKLLPQGLYIHESAEPYMDAALRVLLGCGRALVGQADGANVYKIHRDAPEISFLSYPEFDRRAHPKLRRSVGVNLRSLTVAVRNYSDSENPPILHRKDAFVHKSYAKYDEFRQLTGAEEAAGLLDSGRSIGFRRQWEAVLLADQVLIRGHRLCRRRTKKAGK